MHACPVPDPQAGPETAPALQRRGGRGALVSMTPLVDVMLILLVFFMVTSTYLDLDMIPLAGTDEAPASPINSQVSDRGTEKRVLLSLRADGRVRWRGQTLQAGDLATALPEALSDVVGTEVLVLPSNRASSQSLVSLMEAVTAAGVTRLRVIRLDVRP